MTKEIYLTSEGFLKLEEELDELKKVKRPEIIKLNKTPEYLLSLKDLKTLDNLNELLKTNIDSLKIEGRMKNPEYVATVTRIYRKYIDLAESGEKYVIDENDRKAYIEYLLTEGWECREWYIDECADMIQEMHSAEEAELISAKVAEVLNNCKTEDAATLIADIFDKYYKWLQEGDEKKDEQGEK